jgi:hypothetical protein
MIEEDKPLWAWKKWKFSRMHKVIFLEQKAKEVEIEASMEEELDDRALEENMLQRSGRKVAYTLREEQVNKDIMMGSQKPCENDGRGFQTSKILRK